MAAQRSNRAKDVAATGGSRLPAERSGGEQQLLLRLDALQQVTDAALSTLDLDSLLDSLLARCTEIVGADSGLVLLLDEPGAELVIRGARWMPGETPINYRRRLGEGIAGKMALDGNPRLVLETEREDPQEVAISIQRGIHSILAVPLRVRGKIIGVFRLDSRQPGRFTGQHLQLMQVAADRMALAIDNARLMRENTRLYEETDEKLRARVRELRSLLRLSRAISGQLSPDIIMDRAAEEFVRALDADTCSLCFVDWERGQLTVWAARNRDGGIELGQGRALPLARLPDAYRVLSLRQPVELYRENPETPSQEAAMLLEMGMAFSLLVPLQAGDRVTGIVSLGRRSGRARFTEDDRALAQAMAGQMAVAVENARLFQEVRTQKARMEALLSSMSEGMYATDLEGRITAANPSLEQMLGRHSGEMVGRSCRDILAHTDEEGNLLCDSTCPTKLMLREGTGMERMTVFTLTAWGKRLPSSVSMAPIRDESGQIIGAVAILRDISREWELDRLRSNIISVVSHEFRTPLTSIIGFSELMLMREQPQQERQTCLEQIHGEGLKLEALVNDFLDVSRLEAGRVVLHLEPVEPAAAVMQSLEEAGSRAGRRPLRSEVEDGLPRIEADPEKLHQILGNLLSNAIKYSEDGKPITVRATVGVPQGNEGIPAEGGEVGRWVVFTVEDQGVGIPADQLPEIFTPFHRVEGQATRRIRGTGLGLSIVKSLVELHGGAIWVESEPGVGSRFHVALKAAG